MSRSKKTLHRSATPDPLYGSQQVAKLINRVMKDGKKSIAQAQVYQALEILKNSTKQEPLLAFETAIKNIAPQMEVRSRRVGGAAYQVPMPVKPARSVSLALRWLILEARKRSSKQYRTFAAKLAAEMTDAINNTGGAIQKKLVAHKQAEANRAFAHFRW